MIIINNHVIRHCVFILFIHNIINDFPCLFRVKFAFFKFRLIKLQFGFSNRFFQYSVIGCQVDFGIYVFNCICRYFFKFLYILSLNFIEFIKPAVIQLVFLCLYLLILIFLRVI